MRPRSLKGRTSSSTPKDGDTASIKLAQARERLEKSDTRAAIEYAEAALACSVNPSILRGAIRVIYDSGDIPRAASLVQAFANPRAHDRLSDKLFKRVRERNELIEWVKRPRPVHSSPVVQGRAIYLLAYSLPHVTVGYATRSHGLLKGIQSTDWEVLPYTRLGFPIDHLPELRERAIPELDVIDGVTYRRLLSFTRRGSDEMTYFRNAVDTYSRVIEATRPAVVHAASNHVTGLPALVAARRHGIPFVYEIRGFWEVTRSSSDPAFAKTSTFRHIRFFETLVAAEADHVITLTEGMRRDLVSRGIREDRISLVPNAVDPARFSKRDRDPDLARRLGISQEELVIGYVGSFVDYEGLDDLVDAAAALSDAGLHFRLLFVGDGDALPAIKKQVEDSNLANKTVFTGRVPHEEVSRYYSLLDICPFPRKAWEVCDLVSPLKPLEAMAQQKAVVVSSATALQELVHHEHTGLVFRAGDTDALCRALHILILERELRSRLGSVAHQWVCAHRTWAEMGKACTKVYELASQSLAKQGLAIEGAAGGKAR